MVDLHRGGSLLALLELDVLASVWIMQFSGLHHAIVRTPLVPHAGQIAVEDVIAGVAAVVVHVGPRLAELSALVPGFRRAALDLQRIQHLRGRRAGPGAIRSSAYAEPTGSPMARLAASNPDKTTIIEP